MTTTSAAPEASRDVTHDAPEGRVWNEVEDKVEREIQLFCAHKTKTTVTVRILLVTCYPVQALTFDNFCGCALRSFHFLSIPSLRPLSLPPLLFLLPFRAPSFLPSFVIVRSQATARESAALTLVGTGRSGLEMTFQ